MWTGSLALKPGWSYDVLLVDSDISVFICHCLNLGSNNLKEYTVPSVKMTHVLKTTLTAGCLVKRAQLGVGSQPDEVHYVILSHSVYLDVEDHLFTMADAALWLPAFTSSGGVVLYRPRYLDEDKNPSDVKRIRSEAWQKLLTNERLNAT